MPRIYGHKHSLTQIHKHTLILGRTNLHQTIWLRCISGAQRYLCKGRSTAQDSFFSGYQLHPWSTARVNAALVTSRPSSFPCSWCSSCLLLMGFLLAVKSPGFSLWGCAFWCVCLLPVAQGSSRGYSIYVPVLLWLYSLAFSLSLVCEVRSLGLMCEGRIRESSIDIEKTN